jgi:N-methylhydantoinase B
MNPQTPGPLNSGLSGGIAAARVAFKALTSPDLDVNEGCFRALEVISYLRNFEPRFSSKCM